MVNQRKHILFIFKKVSYFSFSFDPFWTVKVFETAVNSLTMILRKVPETLFKIHYTFNLRLWRFLRKKNVNLRSGIATNNQL